MAQPLTIVMYHYVRDFGRTRYPDIKGLDVAGFRRQLDWLEGRHEIVTMEQVIAAVRDDEMLPPNAALLTFDDGYTEHYDTVFPILHERGVQGSFFPPVTPVLDGVMLDVNRVHFVLASAPSPAPLGASIDEAVRERADDFDLATVEEYRAEWAHGNRFDDAETIYVKRMLQTALPIQLRDVITRQLFERYVSVDESAFAAELYMTRDQARLMVANGMHFGSHGKSHFWLNHLDRATIDDEVDGSLEFLADIGMPVAEAWVMCYPFGGWNDTVLEALRERRCAVGLTTRVDTAQIGTDDALTLPRFDTNDFPQ